MRTDHRTDGDERHVGFGLQTSAVFLPLALRETGKARFHQGQAFAPVSVLHGFVPAGYGKPSQRPLFVGTRGRLEALKDSQWRSHGSARRPLSQPCRR